MTNIVINSDKGKWMDTSYGMAGSWCFVDDFPRNVVISGDNCSSSHNDDCKSIFLMIASIR